MENKIQIGIIGVGTMGRGIAIAAAENKHPVILYDVSHEARTSAIDYIKNIINRKIETNKLSRENGEEILSHISIADALSALNESGLIIEAALENLEIKKNLFKELSGIVNNNCIVASNTSSLPITAIASGLINSSKIIGIHFFNPANVMPLVEIIPGLLTSEDTLKCSRDIITSWGKTVITAKDSPGFIVNRVARPFYTEALRILEEGIAEPAEIDWAIKEFGKFKMGPFELMDLIGLDINFSVTESIFNATFFNPKYRPSIIQQQMVRATMLGKKSGRGFYNYDGTDNKWPDKNRETGERIFKRVLSMLINEAADAVFFNIASPEDIELAMIKGMNFPKGLLQWADESGIDKVLAEIELLYSEYREERYRPSPLLLRMLKNGEKFLKD